jgi:protein disulfide-isomerase A6
VPEYEKAAKALEGIVNIGAVDADANKDLAG